MRKLFYPIGFASWLLSACAPVQRPPVVTPTAIAPKPVAIHTCVPGASVWADGGELDQTSTTLHVTADANGYAVFLAMPGNVTGFNVHAMAADHDQYGAVVHLRAGGPGPGGAGVDRFVGDCEKAARAQFADAAELPAWPENFIPPPRLVPRGRFIGLETGESWFALEASDFGLFELFLRDRSAADRIFDDRKGFKLLRVWTLADVTFSNGDKLHIIPAEHPDFYQQIVPFLQRAAQKGFYVELTAFTGAARLMPELKDQQAHLDAIADAIRQFSLAGPAPLRGPPASRGLLEVGNEYDQGDNHWRAWELRYPTDILVSAGSMGAGSWPSAALPIFDGDPAGVPNGYEEYHFNGLDEWQRKAGHEPMEMANTNRTRVIANEGTRPDQDAKPEHYFDAFAACKLLAAGCDFHSAAGRISRPFNALERALANQALAGAGSIPLRCQDGPYNRADNAAPLLRLYWTYQNDPNCVAKVRK